jgi:Bacterial regulatory protein, Fis family
MKDKFDALVEYLLNGGIFLPQAIEVLEKNMIQGALGRCGGNQCAASKLLGIHRNTLLRKIREYELGSGRARARRKPVGRQGGRQGGSQGASQGGPGKRKSPAA